MPTPNDTANLLRDAMNAKPTAVSIPGDGQNAGNNIWNDILGAVPQWVKTIGTNARDVGVGLFSGGSSEFGVPGTAPIARAAASGIVKVSTETAGAVASVGKAAASDVTAAGAGIKSGFTWGVLIIVLLIGFMVYREFR